MRWLTMAWACWFVVVVSACGALTGCVGHAGGQAVPLPRYQDDQWSEATTELLRDCFAKHAKQAAEAYIQPSELEQLCIQQLKLAI